MRSALKKNGPKSGPGWGLLLTVQIRPSRVVLAPQLWGRLFLFLSPCRHTMKDKMRTIRATAELQHSILGHGKRTDADNYGEGELLRYLLDELVKADALTHWGN